MNSADELAVVAHAGMLEDQAGIPGYLLPDPEQPRPLGPYSCSFCGLGDSGFLESKTEAAVALAESITCGRGVLRTTLLGSLAELEASVHEGGRIAVATAVPLTSPGGVITGELQIQSKRRPITLREIDRKSAEDGGLISQSFLPYKGAVSISDSAVKRTAPTSGCVKLKLSMMRQRAAFPIHVAPSILDRAKGERRSISYQDAITRFADLVLAHRRPHGRTLIYACGQVDYFTVFAFQEVFRLLGVRNLAGNAEHCLNAGAVHNEMLTGQEGPFLTVAQGLEGANRFYLLNGWNGFITHPPAFHAILKRSDLDAYLVEVMVTESAKALAEKLGPERVLLVRPRSDPHLALAVAHEILSAYAEAVDNRFVEFFSDVATFQGFVELARSPRFAPERVAERIAPEPVYVERILKGIRMIAFKLTRPGTVPINIPSVGLSQTSGAVAHCLWGSVLAILGKFGLRADGSPAGGTCGCQARSMQRPRCRACRGGALWAASRLTTRRKPRTGWGCPRTPMKWPAGTAREPRWTTRIRRRIHLSFLFASEHSLSPT